MEEKKQQQPAEIIEHPPREPEKIRDASGRFTSGNPGRPKGAANKMTKELRNKILSFVLNHIDDLETDYKYMFERERVALLLQLTKLVLPRIKPQELETGDDPERTAPIVISLGPGQDLNELIPDGIKPGPIVLDVREYQRETDARDRKERTNTDKSGQKADNAPR